MKRSTLIGSALILTLALALTLSEARVTTGGGTVTYTYTANMTDAQRIGAAFLWAYKDQAANMNLSANGTLTTAQFVDYKVSGYIQDINGAYQNWQYEQAQPPAVAVSLT